MMEPAFLQPLQTERVPSRGLAGLQAELNQQQQLEQQQQHQQQQQPKQQQQQPPAVTGQAGAAAPQTWADWITARGWRGEAEVQRQQLLEWFGASPAQPLKGIELSLIHL